MTELSPAAQAVLNATNQAYDQAATVAQGAAAALCAAAEMLSKEVDAPGVDGSKYAGLWHSFDYLNAIAAELKDQ